MKTSATSAETLMVALLLTPFVYLAFIWNQLPPMVASHYDWRGIADDTMPKGTLAGLLADVSLGLYLLLRFLPNLDPKGRLQGTNYQKLRLVITALLAAIVGWAWYRAAHPANVPFSPRIPFTLVGLLLAGVGNYLTTIKPNWFVGIRTPWTMESETVWRRTHRLGGRLMVAGGLLIVAFTWLLPLPYVFTATIGVVLLVSLIPVIVSYVYFRQEKARQLN